MPLPFSQPLLPSPLLPTGFKQLQHLETSIKHALTTYGIRQMDRLRRTHPSLTPLTSKTSSRHPSSVKAEAAVMNLSSNILALRSGKMIQMFNLDMKQKLKSHDMG
eukprot:g9078.t1 g9078   contig34:798181-798498(-)